LLASPERFAGSVPGVDSNSDREVKLVISFLPAAAGVGESIWIANLVGIAACENAKKSWPFYAASFQAADQELP
jgi:hypothetical protein